MPTPNYPITTQPSQLVTPVYVKEQISQPENPTTKNPDLAPMQMNSDEFKQLKNVIKTLSDRIIDMSG